MPEWGATAGVTSTDEGLSTIHSPYYDYDKSFQESSRRAV